jgi:hypothetical protein
MVFLRSLRRLLDTVSVVPSSSILVTLMKETLSSSETSALARAIRRSIPEDAILNLIFCFCNFSIFSAYKIIFRNIQNWTRMEIQNILSTSDNIFSLF